MRGPTVVALFLVAAAPVWAADPIAEARRLYNIGQYEAAERIAREAMATPGTADAGHVVFARIKLERYRQSDDPADLTDARASLTRVDPRALETRERVELIVGLAEALYLERRFGASAELFDSALEPSRLMGPGAHERVLDWWATALDREARALPFEQRAPVYDRILARMHEELSAWPGSSAAAYWIAAAARARGNPEAAWHAALAGWVRATLAEDRGAALRADLDRLMMQAIIPERAAKVTPGGDAKQAQVTMLSEWDAFKAAWSR